MSERANHFKIGVFVLFGFGLLIFALFALGLKSYLVKKDLFETYVTGRVENLSVGAPVKLRGVAIGKVTAINFIWKEQPNFKEQYVAITFEVPRDAGVVAPSTDIQQMLDKQVAEGLRARVQGQGFLGPSILSLEYVDPKAYPILAVSWTPKHYYIPSAPSQFDHLFSTLEKTLNHVEELDLAQLLERTQNLIDKGSRLVDSVNRVDFHQLGANANSFVTELRESNRGLQRTLTDAQGAIKGADLPTVSREAQALEGRLSNAAIELRRVLASVDTGELNGSLANIRGATDELTVLLHDLEQRPSSLLFSKSPRPAKGMEEPPRK